MSNNKDAGVSHVFAKMADNTAMHGLPNVKNRKSKQKRIFWLIVIIVALGLLIWQITSLVIKYRSYPVSTTTEIVYQPMMTFPSITFCNLNPVRSSADGVPTKFKHFMKMEAPSRPQRPGMGPSKSAASGPSSVDKSSNSGGSPGASGPTEGSPEASGPSERSPEASGPTERIPEASGPTEKSPGRSGLTEGSEASLLSGVSTTPLPDDGGAGGDDQNIQSPPARTKRSIFRLKRSAAGSTSNDTESSYGQTRQDFALSEELYYTFMTMEERDRKEAGHSLDQMLLDCSWKGQLCGPENFTVFSNWRYGNCFTFNSGIDENTSSVEPLTVDNPGSLDGLMLKIYVQSEEYIDVLDSAVGIRLVVHNQSAVPFPETDGILVRSGTYTEIGINTIYLSREDPPHGVCNNFTTEEGKLKNAYMESQNISGYSRQGCINTCIQRMIILACNCSSFRYPNTGKAFEDLDENTRLPCEYSNEADDCIEAQQTLASQVCTKPDICPDRCVDFEYTLTSTVAEWPRSQQQKRILLELADLAAENNDTKLLNLLDTVHHNQGATDTFVGQNVLTLKIFLKDLKYLSYTTKASFGIEDFLSALGGTGGLWLGISVVTVFELIEVVLELFGVCLNSKRKVDPNRQTSPDETIKSPS